MVSTKDYTGQKFYRLTFIRPTLERDGSTVVWEALCDCGNITYVSGSKAARGKVKSCGCFIQEARIESGLKTRKYDPVISIARRVWRSVYKELDFDSFLRLSQEICHYCGTPPSKKRKDRDDGPYRRNNGAEFIFNGLDRIDSNLEHTIDNIVPCCWTCNRMKGDMNYHDFIRHIAKIYGYTSAPKDNIVAATSQAE